MTHYEIKSQKELRSGMGEGLVEAGRRNENIVALSADVKGSVKMDGFAKEFPDRFVQCGIAEANMVGIAAGLSLCGKVPFIGGFAEFVTGRVYDQIRQVLCYSRKNVKICGSHAGISLGEDGATHQTMEDIALMKVLPNMTVLVPCDFNQAKAATLAAAELDGPVYLRLGRSKMPNFTPEDQKFEIGKAQLLSEGKDVTLIACGHLVWEALQAAEMLEKVGISAEVLNIHTIKPLDEEAILTSVRKTGAVVTCEEHLINGGLGDSVAQVLARHLPTPQEYVAVDDRFGESGTPDEMLTNYHLRANDIMAKAYAVLQRKPGAPKQRYCQSCGMPLNNPEDVSDNPDYCKYCHKDGHFTQECTMEQMVDFCVQFVDEFNKNTGQHLTADEYRQQLLQYFPQLKRWQK
ncbi:MAG: transketolase family protein [Bacteroidales bacterium]|nr:transketolase family protein [Bacteroidales bacterium]